MNARIKLFLNAENISQSQFADTLGIARASVSHIIAGRNKPGYDFLERLMKSYPKLNVKWLMLGEGRMYSTTAENTVAPIEPIEQPVESVETQLFSSVESINPEQKTIPNHNIKISESTDSPKSIDTQRKISKILVLYNDNTYEELI